MRSRSEYPLRLLYVGRLSREKGLYETLQGVRLATELGVDARLIVAGEGPEEARLRRYAQALGISSRVAFAGQAIEEHERADPARREPARRLEAFLVQHGAPVAAAGRDDHTRAAGFRRPEHQQPRTHHASDEAIVDPRIRAALGDALLQGEPLRAGGHAGPERKLGDARLDRGGGRSGARCSP